MKTLTRLSLFVFLSFLFLTPFSVSAASPTVLDSGYRSVEVTSATSWTITDYTVSGTGQNRALLVMMNINSSDVTATWNGVSMTKLVNIAGSQRARGIFFYLASPDSGNHNLVFSWSVARSDYSAVIMTTQDTAQTSPDDSAGGVHSNSASATAQTVSITTNVDSDLVVVWMLMASGVSVVDNVGQTNIANFFVTDTGDNNTLSTIPVPTATTITPGYTWTNSGSDDIYAVAIKYLAPSAASAPASSEGVIIFE